MASRFSIGLDFGTESVRVLVVDIRNGRIVGQASHNYEHGVIDQTLSGTSEKLPADYALQHPQDWLSSAAAACKKAIRATAASTTSSTPSTAPWPTPMAPSRQ